MKTIFADYNAATESGHLRLTFDVSQVAIKEREASTPAIGRG